MSGPESPSVGTRSGVDDEITVRNALATDALGIADVHVRSFQAAYRGLMPQDALDSLDVAARDRIWARRIAEADGEDRRIAVAEVEDRVVAFVYFGPAPDEEGSSDRSGHVFSVHADPGFTGRGIGAALMAHVVMEMSDAAFVDATLWVVTGNPGARRFYERLGWRSDGARRTELLGLPGEPGADYEAETVRYRLEFGATS